VDLVFAVRERRRLLCQVEAVAYDNPVPGYDTGNTINLRLWAGKPSAEFDLQSFNTGDYVAAILAKQRAETISSVLYPDDRTYQVRAQNAFFDEPDFFIALPRRGVNCSNVANDYDFPTTGCHEHILHHKFKR
jgi:hypothetical protein